MLRSVRPLFIATIVVAVVALGPAGALAAPSTYDVDKSHSALMFRIKHLDVAFTYGRFNDFSGTLVVDEENLAASSVEITAQMTSVDTNEPKRDQHLRSPDFFNVNQFPTMTFKGKAVERHSDGAFKVDGNLTLHGVTKPVSVKMMKTGEGDDPWGKYRIGFEGTFVIKRSDFGMDKMQEAVGDSVWITVAVEGIRK